jgi:hypothetical protein
MRLIGVNAFDVIEDELPIA